MKIPVHNPTGMPMYVGATMIPAGETFHFEENDVPLSLRPADSAPAPAEEIPVDPLATLLGGSIKDIVSALTGMDADTLLRLEQMEQAGQARKGALAAIAEALLESAGKEQEKLAAEKLEEAARLAADKLKESDAGSDPVQP